MRKVLDATKPKDDGDVAKSLSLELLRFEATRAHRLGVAVTTN
jgi:hypothetical protein